MSPQLSTIIEIKNWLKEKHVIVPNDWIEACVNFLEQEYSNPNLPVHRLKTLVYEQWLVADLEEICSSSLPPQLNSLNKTSLNGCFALQVNGIRDIGKPAYTQLRQLERTENTDVEVSAAPKEYVPEWEAKPTRMLLLNLTDGVNFVQGMEYTPISCLSPNLPPGVKILITGPLDCRFGILMLSADKIKVLGGEVEKYQMAYSREEMLRKALKTPSRDSESSVRNNQPGSGRVSENFFESAQSTIDSARNEIQVLTSTSNASTRNNERLSHFQTNHTRKDSSLCRSDSIDTFDCDDVDDDDFVRSLDYRALDEIERANSQEPNHVKHKVDESMLDDVDEFERLSDTDQDISDVFPPEADEEFETKISKEEVPCTLLSSVDQDRSDEFSVTIKGFIINVLSRLECKSNTGWHLTAKVSDGSASIEAAFHDKVLEEFVGISAKEMMALQVEARRNEQVKNRIMEAVRSCKSKLQELNCFMEIKFSPGQHPCVLKCFE